MQILCFVVYRYIDPQKSEIMPQHSDFKNYANRKCADLIFISQTLALFHGRNFFIPQNNST